MKSSILSRRYAQALFDIAHEEHAIIAIRSDCTLIINLLNESVDFLAFIHDPLLDKSDAMELIHLIFDQKVHKITLDFLILLVEKKRLDQLLKICMAYEELICEYLNILKIEVITARPFTDEQIQALKERLQERYNKEIEAKIIINSSLIGGFTIKAGDHIQDFSILEQLNQFEQKVINAEPV